MAKKRTVPFEREKGSHTRVLAKMNGVAWPTNPEFLQDAIIELGYQNIETLNDRSVRGVKPNYAFSSNVPGRSFRFDSRRGAYLIDAQRELFAVLARDYKVRMEDHVAYYKMVHVCEYILDDPVDATYGKMLDGSDAKSLFESVTGRDLVLNKLEMSSGSRIDANDWYSVEISTRVESSGNTLYCNMMRISVDLGEIHKALRGAPNTISKLVDKITATH